MLKFAKRVDSMKGSAARAMLNITRKPGVISFAGGLPAPELFPVKEYAQVAQLVIQENGSDALQYGPTLGYMPLREKIAERMEKSGVMTDASQIMVTSGSQQGLEFMAKLFIDSEDIIVCESPSYLGAMTAFSSYEPKYIDIKTDDDGMDMEELEKVLKTHDRIKYIYVIPDFQNPSGKTWSLERRIRLVELANQYDVAILEDNPYGELRFEGEMLPAIKHFDTEGRVVFLGTFSKIFSPGLRLGWINATEEIIDKFNLIKQGADLQSSTISQMEMVKFMEMFDLEKHIDTIKEVYKKRKNLMLHEMEKHFPDSVSYTNPKGGLFVWVTLPEGCDASEISAMALEEKVAFITGDAFFPNGSGKNYFRMNFSNMDEERIVEGIRRLGVVLQNALK